MTDRCRSGEAPYPSRERTASRRLGRALPPAEGLALLADYLAGLSGALAKRDLRRAATAALPQWESYVRGVGDRLRALADENP